MTKGWHCVSPRERLIATPYTCDESHTRAQPTSTKTPVVGWGTRLGRTIALHSWSRCRSFGSSGLWSFVSGTVISGASFRAPTRERPRTARESPTKPTVTTRPPSGARSSLARIAVVPEKRASIPERASPAAVCANAVPIASTFRSPAAAAANAEKRLRWQ